MIKFQFRILFPQSCMIYAHVVLSYNHSRTVEVTHVTVRMSVVLINRVEREKLVVKKITLNTNHRNNR
jgi:hypothetical protein